MFVNYSKSAIEPADPVRVLYAEIEKYFGHKLPDFEQEPIRFAWLCKLYAFQMKQRHGLDIKFPPEAITDHKLDVRV